MSKTEGVMENKEMEFDLVHNPHPHPLIYYRQGKPDGQQFFCYKCNLEFFPPAFACSDDTCNFNIHQSCIDLPDEIRNPFHDHVLRASQVNNFPCNCCWQSQYGTSYVCNNKKCEFSMDVQCVMANPKASGLLKATRGGELRHFSHSHPLTLHPGTDTKRIVSVSICLICQLPITSTSPYYSCSRLLPQCRSYNFHQPCAELSRQKLYPNIHPKHPLVLLGRKPFRCVCACCETECMNFFYSCHTCEFYLHVHCLPSFNHKHDFHQLLYKVSFECTICHISNKAIPWTCRVCYLLAHKECAIFKMSQDQFHSSSTQDHDPNLNQLGNKTKHFSHKHHELTLCQLHEDMLCDGCMRYIPATSRSYACPPCKFHLHKQCATLPVEHTNSFLHPHVLSLFYIPDFMFSCAICLQYCHGFAYRCEECYYVIDIQCAATTFSFKHPIHNHSLTYHDGSEEYACKACGENLKFKKVIGCLECQFYLHIRCARLPLAMINRFDEHPLILTIENHKEESEETEYYCDVCEEKRNKNKWFYECRMCRFAAHIECVVGDYPFLKSALFKNHAHPLTLVDKCSEKRHSSISCDDCGDSLDGKLAFKCGNSNCNFYMHAFGQCYHNRLTQGQITFTMPSLRYRSISLHPKQKWKLSFYTTTNAKKVTLDPDEYLTSIHGWHGKNEDPDEYLTSIHGWHRKNENHREHLIPILGRHNMDPNRLLSSETIPKYLADPFGKVKDKYEFIKLPTSIELKVVDRYWRSTKLKITAIGFHFIEL